ncbi:MAG: peptidoglycan-binding protein [Alphaproteobacteria bacterium]
MPNTADRASGAGEYQTMPNRCGKARELISAAAVKAAAEPWAGVKPAPRARALRRISVVAAAFLVSACSTVTDVLDRLPKWGDDAEQPTPAAEAPQTDTAKAPPTPKTPPVPKAKPSHEMVSSVQRMLTELGYEPGPVDGVAGPKTRRAIRDFQADAKLRADGKVTEALVTKLAKFVNGDPQPAAEHGLDGKPQPAPEHGLDGKVMPIYEPGDVFVYSDGQVETVTGVEGVRVIWATNRGARVTAYTNFILPPVSWETTLRSETTTVDAPVDVLWPLEVGKVVTFSVRTKTSPVRRRDTRSVSSQNWRCRVDGTDTVTVAAGTFATYRVACRSSPPPPSLSAERVWYYAPSIRHYVRRDETKATSKLPQRVELVAVRLKGEGWPPAARAGLGWAFQHALETQSMGDSVEWQSSGVDTKVTITPTASLRSDDPSYCRTFEQTILRPASRRVFPGIACRDPSGHWSIPGLDDQDTATGAGS